MFRLFVSCTSPRRSRSATPEVVGLEQILSLSSIAVASSNLGTILPQKIHQAEVQKVTATNTAKNVATANGNSNAQNYTTTTLTVTSGSQTMTANNTTGTTTNVPVLVPFDLQYNGGIGGLIRT